MNDAKVTLPGALRAHLLMYDIPQSSKLMNPSAKLWRLGARVNLSCWIIPDKNVPRIPITDLEAGGAIVEIVRFDERDGETILRLAREALTRELDAVRSHLDASIATVRAKYEGIAAGDEDALTKASRYAYGQVYRAKRFLVHAQECALAFDMLGDVERLMDGVRETIKAKEAVFFELHKAVEQHRPLERAQIEAAQRVGQ